MTQSTPDSKSGNFAHKPDRAARRTRLREFQAQLLERMQLARTGTDTRVNQLGVMVGEKHCLLDLQQVSEIMSVGVITKVPLTQDWYLGLSNIRGNLISVIDLSRFQGLALSPIEQESRIVAFAPSLSFNCGLLVSRVLGLRNLAEMEPDSGTPEVVSPWSTQYYRDRESAVWTQLDLSLMVQDPRFLHIGL